MAGEFDDAQRAELLRLVRALKKANLATTVVEGPAETLSALADQAEALVRAMAESSHEADGSWPLPPFGEPTELPFSPISGPLNPNAPDAVLSVEGAAPKHVVARVRFSQLYEGPPSFVHGGWIAAMFDQVLGVANHANATGGLTASITVRYRKPTPINTELRFDAWTERTEGRKVFTRGECRNGDELLTECEGVFVRVDAALAKRLFGPKA